MARIPEEVIERLKQEVALERLVELAGVELRRQGKDLVGRCPFHEDRTPSLVITPAKNLWHCMGACQAGGSVIDWVMRAESVSFPHAVELLGSGAGTVVAHDDPDALVAALRQLLTDPHVADSMATEARGLAPTIAWPVVANAYVGAAQRLLATQSALT